MNRRNPEIESVFNSFQKVELEDFGSIFGKELSSRLKKSEMVGALSYYIESHPRKWLSCMLERDLRLLKTLVDAGPGKTVYMDYPTYPSILEAAGLIEGNDDGDNFHACRISRDFHSIVAPYVDDVLREGEQSGRFRIERVALGILNLYGVLPYEDFLDLITDWYEDTYGSDFKFLTQSLKASPLLKVARCTDSDGNGEFVCSPCVEAPERVIDAWAGFEDIVEFMSFGYDEVEDAGNGAPFFTVGLKTPQGKALVSMLTEIGYSGSQLVRAEHDLWLYAQSDLDSAAMLDSVDYMLDMVGSPSSYRACLKVMSDYINSVPKWVLGGHSASDTGYLLVDLVPREDSVEEPSPADGEVPSWNMPKPTISEGYTDLIEKNGALEALSAILPEGFPFGMAIPHVSPEDPCPCGSGLKYKNCHGKLLS